MGKNERINFIREIEELRESKVITYIVGDREGLPFQISGDVPRLFYRHLKNIGDTSRVDLFLYSSGGDTSVPWRVISIFREFCDEFNVIVPFKAYSAATMIALGADNLILGKKSELSPIDPAITTPFNPKDPTGRPIKINVESVTSYFSLLQDKLGIKRKEDIKDIFLKLSDKVEPLALGEVNRHHSYIRMVAKRILESRKNNIGKENIDKIIKTLIEEKYYHGHSISRREAEELGIPIIKPDSDLEEKIWGLYREYENEMNLLEPFSHEGVLDQHNADHHVVSDLKAAYIESQVRTDVARTEAHITRHRQLPQNLNLNLNLQLPPLPEGEPQEDMQRYLMQLQPQIQEQIFRIIREQAPVTGLEVQARGKWTTE